MYLAIAGNQVKVNNQHKMSGGDNICQLVSLPYSIPSFLMR